MLDRKFIVENSEAVKRNCRDRGVAADVDRFLALEGLRRERQAEVENLNRRANEVSKSIGQAKDATEREARKEEGRQLRERTGQLRAELDALAAEQEAIHRWIPNMSHPDAPRGRDDQANREVGRGKTPLPEFDFEPLDHVELAERLDLIDFAGGARVAGHGFYFLKNEAVLLELALQRYALGLLIGEGFTPMTTPDLASNQILEGTGYIPRGPETQIYSIENQNLSLIATAEITLGGLLAGQTVDAEALPLKLCGVSHCFRTEAGAHGKESRGLFRVHQFTKVEMFAFTLPDDSEAMLEYLRELECRLFDGLAIPYRVVDTATGDLGGPAYRKYDLEAWLPGRGGFGEVTSTSNCTDYQARRLNARFKVKGEKGTRFVHTLNGTAIAISRALIAVLENHQQADGSVAIPEPLRAVVGKDVIEPRK
ncbi:MAG: serine--tRNA ligase [Pirellulales bacterium]|jgi:seryl-tRNA synthetase|nr:serine--tRNA ligase [Thermoguttaceae bacterium]MDD4785600.1 serine--tRNA ligase [Pirellulales bacterium]MDI9442617.1 serine--tRNA ligase [Planctomycetota bacterium]NLZ02083.1 serine--tRNA ligase [Pirellulaceae bacterium]